MRVDAGYSGDKFCYSESCRKRFSLGLRLSFDEYLGILESRVNKAKNKFEFFRIQTLWRLHDISGGGYHNLHIAVAPMGTVTEGFLASSAARVKKLSGRTKRSLLSEVS